MPIAVDHLHVFEPVLPQLKAEHRHTLESLRLCSFKAHVALHYDITRRDRAHANSWELGEITVGSSIWASDLESVQELKPHGSRPWENLASGRT